MMKLKKYAVMAGAIALVAFLVPLAPAHGAGAPSVTTLSPVNIGQTSATFRGHTSQNIADKVTVWFEYGTAPSSLNTSTGFNVISWPQSANTDFSAAAGNLISGTTYFYRAVAKNSQGITPGAVVSFTTDPQNPPPGESPDVTTNSATAITETSATVRGTVNPNGSFTDAWFEWGTSNNLGSIIGQQSIGNGNANVDLSFTFQNLAPNTTYYFRAAATNSFGTSYGSIRSFTTQPNAPSGGAPDAITNSAFSVAQTSATLQGSVNPNGLSALAWFEWGTSHSLGNSTFTQNVGNGTSNVNVTVPLSSLTANTTYYFRIVASNSAGTAYGSIFSFTTQGFGGGGGGGGSGAPTVGTNSATGVTNQRATVNGVVNPNNSYTSTWFEWGTSSSFFTQMGGQGMGNGNATVGFSFTFVNLVPGTTYYFRAVAQNSFGTSYGSTLSFTTFGGDSGNLPSVATFSPTSVGQNSATFQGSVNPNNSFANAWFEWGSTFSLGNITSQQSVGSGSGTANYSFAVTNLILNTTYYFRAVASNNFGTAQGSILSFSTGASFIPSGSGIPFVSTNGASFVETTSAQLNSTVDPRGSLTTARFEWGTTPSLGSVTLSRDIGSGYGTAQSSWFLGGLSPNTVYYFRSVAENRFGASRGTIVSFITKSLFTAPPPAPGTVSPPPVASLDPSLILDPSANETQPAPGETITYTLRYRNESATRSISRLVARISFPQNISYGESTITPASQNGTSVTFNLGSLEPQGENSFEITFRVAASAKEGDALPLNATVDYRDAVNRPHTATAVLTLTVSGAGFLARLLGLDIPLGWILLAIFLILITIFFSRRSATKSAPLFAVNKSSIGAAPKTQH